MTQSNYSQANKASKNAVFKLKSNLRAGNPGALKKEGRDPDEPVMKTVVNPG